MIFGETTQDKLLIEEVVAPYFDCENWPDEPHATFREDMYPLAYAIVVRNRRFEDPTTCERFLTGLGTVVGAMEPEIRAAFVCAFANALQDPFGHIQSHLEKENRDNNGQASQS